MNKKELLSFLLEQFPKAIGFVLTGSQSRNSTFNTVSDIDVMVFDIINSDVYSRGAKVGQYRIDCTIIAVFDIENIILTEFYDLKGTIINMVTSGTILHDTNNIIKNIKNSTRPLSNKINSRVKAVYQQSVEELLKLRKYLERDLTEGEKVLLACDFVSAISKIEVIRANGWNAVNLRKAQLLDKHNAEFVSEIVKMHKKAMEGDNLQFLVGYINNYQNNLIRFNDEEPSNILFDIAVPNFSLQQFSQEILPVIISHPALKSCYRYFYTSLKKYHRQYKYDVSICFNLKENITIADLVNELSRGINILNENKVFRFEVIHPLEKFSNNNLANTIEELRVTLCKLANALIIQGTYIKGKFVNMALVLCSKINHLLALDIEEICFLNTFLMQRYLLNYMEQKNAKEHHYLVTLGKEKQKNWDMRYSTDKEYLLAIMDNETATESFILPQEVNLFYEETITKLEAIIQNKNFDFNTLYLPDSLLHFIKLVKMKEGRAYLILTEEILLMFNLSDSDKAYCLYILSKGFMDNYFL